MDFINKKQLDTLVDYVNKLLKMKSDKKFQKFIQNKCLEVLDSVINNNLIGGTTNDDAIELYMGSNHIEEYDEGFILYNDAKIPANLTGITSNPDSYPDGQFSIALAFEYGVGIVGESTNNSKAWAYDVNNHGNAGWVFVKDDGNWERTSGYQGFQIYTLTAQEIQTKLPEWVYEYVEKEV